MVQIRMTILRGLIVVITVLAAMVAVGQSMDWDNANHPYHHRRAVDLSLRAADAQKRSDNNHQAENRRASKRIVRKVIFGTRYPWGLRWLRRWFDSVSSDVDRRNYARSSAMV